MRSSTSAARRSRAATRAASSRSAIRANATYTFVLQHGGVAAGNTPSGSGAGLYKATGGPWQVVTIEIFDVDFSDNHAITTAQDDGGGAIYVVGAAELAVVGSTFSANSGANGGALYSLGSKA